jgi:hypothetical protein
MRDDMGKCVIERPRRGSGNRSAKARWYGTIHEDETGELDYDGFTRLPVSSKQEGYHKRIGDKDFTDVLGPIEGYLRASVGRRWDDVYSELSKGLGQSSWPLRHVLTQHVNVAVKTYLGTDGKIWHLNKRGPEIVDGRYGTEFYVHPKTKLLCWRQPKSWKRRAEPGQATTDRIEMPDGRWLVKIDGLWFVGTYRLERPPAGLHQSVPEPTWPNFRVGWRDGVMVFTKIKSANQKEIRGVLRA